MGDPTPEPFDPPDGWRWIWINNRPILQCRHCHRTEAETHEPHCPSGECGECGGDGTSGYHKSNGDPVLTGCPTCGGTGRIERYALVLTDQEEK